MFAKENNVKNLGTVRANKLSDNLKSSPLADKREYLAINEGSRLMRCDAKNQSYLTSTQVIKSRTFLVPFCDKCEDYVYEYCAIHGPLLVVPDDKIYDRNNKPCHVVDAEDANKSNWMRYVNCARHCSEQNLVAYQYQGQLYYRTIKIIPRFTELMVFYGSEFAHFLQIDLRRYNSPAALLEIIDAPLPKKPRLDTENKKIDQHDSPKETRKVADSKEITKNGHNENTGSDTKPKVQTNTKPNRQLKTFNKPRKPIETDKNNNKMTNNVFKCNDCNKQYDKKSDLVEHIQSHDKTKQNIYFKCKQCSYTDIIQDTLQRHIENVHSNKDKKHECSICDYRSNNIGHINRHLLIHSGAKPYSCSMCEFKCSQKEDLKRHLRIHTGEKPYSCSMCEYKCSVKGSLNKHLRIHTGEKPYSCSMCEYKCSVKGSLNKHLRIHTGEKPYSCSMCEYKCSQKGALKTHLNIHCK